MTREEVAADLLWCYVQHVREARAAGEDLSLSPAEIEQLGAALSTASRVPEALDQIEACCSQAAVRARLQPVLGKPSETAAPAGAAGHTPWIERLRGTLVPAWQLGAAAALCLSLGLALVSVNSWHRPEPIIRQVRVPFEAPDVQPLDERQAHDLLPRMVRNELAPRDEKSLMWHMLVCPGCFNHYVQLKGSGATVSDLRRERVRLAGL